MLDDLMLLPEWREVCQRYRYDITRFAVEALDMTIQAGQAVTWQQELLFKSIVVPGSRTSVASGHGCFGIDTPIMLSTGKVKKVQDIQVGDKLMGDDGNSVRNVLELKRGQENLYRFNYSDGSSHVFNESHILCLVATNSKGRRKTGDKITVTVREWLEWGEDKKRCHAVYRNKVESYERGHTSLPIDPYILGTWLGDGHSNGPTITSMDSEIIKSWRDYAPLIGCKFTKHKFNEDSKAQNYGIAKLSASNKHINHFYHALKKLNLIKNKHIPDCYLYADIDSRRELLAGLIDTDGSLDGCGYDFAQKDENLSYQIYRLARSIGCHATIKKVKKKCGNNGVVGDYFRVTIGRNIDAIPVRVERKKRPNRPHQRRNLNFGIKSVEPLGLGDYYGFVLDGNSQFLGGDFTVLHNTGKSRSAGIIALWHLLFYPESVMLFTAPQIGQLRTVVWKEINICLQRLRNNKALGWLADYVVVLAEKIYIKGFKDTWFVFAKTAPKHQPTNIAGQHGDHYMVWADEACGIDDAVMEVAIGALTHENNRAVLTSQPAKNTGFFYDTHHKLSHHNGGKWTALEFNGEMSPIVSKEKLIEALYQYGSRNSPGYLIRIRGKFPELKGEYLLTRTDYENMKAHPCVIEEGDKWGIIVTVDVGGDVGRDSSVISVMQVVDKMIKGRIERHVHLLDIPLFSNRANINTLKAKINDVMSDYPGATLVIDPLGAGMGLTQSVKADGVYFDEVHWGSPCFNNTLKRYYMNKRSHAYVSMAKAVEKGYFSISDKVKKMYQVMTNLEEQMTRLPYYFDEKARWCMMSKKDMLKKGIKSPDIADTIAFGFMENISYAPVESYEDLNIGSAESDELDLLKQAADELLGE